MWFDLRKEQQNILPPQLPHWLSLPNPAYSERTVDLLPKLKRPEREAKGSQPFSAEVIKKRVQLFLCSPLSLSYHVAQTTTDFYHNKFVYEMRA